MRAVIERLRQRVRRQACELTTREDEKERLRRVHREMWARMERIRLESERAALRNGYQPPEYRHDQWNG